MESHPQNPEFRISPKNLYPCLTKAVHWLHWNSYTWSTMLSQSDIINSTEHDICNCSLNTIIAPNLYLGQGIV